MAHVELNWGGKQVELPVVEGTRGDRAVDISELRKKTGLVTLDPGYKNTGSCCSSVTFIDGERGILQHRGRPIEDLTQGTSFTDVAHLLVFGRMPGDDERARWESELKSECIVPPELLRVLDGAPRGADPITILASAVLSLSAFCPPRESVDEAVAPLLAKTTTLAAFAHRRLSGLPYLYPSPHATWAADLLRMMFERPDEPYDVPSVEAETLNLLLILHADHEQNCSTSTMRMIGSSGADVFSATAGAIGALSGPRHGRANQRVVEMLRRIRDEGGDVRAFVDRVKDKKERLMGFGHRVYKSYDPRARILKDRAGDILERLGADDPLLDLARTLEDEALGDDYFVERGLYPNVDFYSGTLFRALGIPENMFTVFFALGRLPGWIAHYREMLSQGSSIHRPRQVYVGE